MNRVPLFLVAGMLSDRHVWSTIVPALSDLADAHPVDIGLTDSVEAVADRILADAPERFALAGHSLGGRVVFEAIRRAPERVVLAGLLGTAYRGRPPGEAGDKEAAARQAMIEAAQAEGLRAYARKWVQRMVLPSRLDDAALIEPILDMAERVGLEGLRAHVRMGLSRPDATDVLPAIAAPTLVLCADGDVAMPLGPHQEMAAAIPGATLTVVQDSGHMLMLERPEPTIAAMREWLGRWPG